MCCEGCLGLFVTNFHARLKIEAQTSGINIGRADLRIVIIHYEEFAVHEGRRLVLDPAPSLQ